MPRYFFNTRIGEELISDPEGEELRDPDRAWEVGRAMIRELLKSEGTGGGLLNAVLEVTDTPARSYSSFPLPRRSWISPTFPPRDTDAGLRRSSTRGHSGFASHDAPSDVQLHIGE